MVELLLPAPKIRSLNLVIGNFFLPIVQLSNEKTKIKKKEAGNGPSLKNPAGSRLALGHKAVLNKTHGSTAMLKL